IIKVQQCKIAELLLFILDIREEDLKTMTNLLNFEIYYVKNIEFKFLKLLFTLNTLLTNSYSLINRLMRSNIH
ncbi:hypothetical protein CN321_29555, partial [Bacillus thuringiensis]|uniref:hypothetical protein n=1 Tax=Bacillus thuringiensis TaxID=1428 RepID=UPI000BFB0357